MFKFLFLPLTITLALRDRDDLIVSIKEGSLQGKFLATRNGKLISSFTGIPYAEPPLGPLRFKPPVPMSPWRGVKDATKIPNVCAQKNIYSAFEGKEDCLYLNVFTPKLKFKQIKDYIPVMVFIHGGAFLSGNPFKYKPDYLLDKDVILITFSYRLGFLSTGDKVVPGNNGLKDQNLALKWVRNNIKSFGGDPNRITLFGQSAGSISVTLHNVSPLSIGLFQNIMTQSGTAYFSLAVTPKGEELQLAKKLARICNCPTDDNEVMVDCLREIDAEIISDQTPKYQQWSVFPIPIFKVVIEPDHEGAFLSEHPVILLKTGQTANVPWLKGITSYDGLTFAVSLVTENYLVGDLNDRFDVLAPIALMLIELTRNITDVTDQIRKFYFGNEAITMDKRIDIVNLFTDRFFLNGAVLSNLLQLKQTNASPIYYYLFDYKGTVTNAVLFGDNYPYDGPCHCDDLLYLFPLAEQEFPTVTISEKDERMIDFMVQMWTDFARTGNPTPVLTPLVRKAWHPISTNRMEYYYIGGPDNSKMDVAFYENRTMFWEKMANDFYFYS